MTPYERPRLPRVASLLFTLAVGAMAAVVLYEVASAVGMTPADARPTPGPIVAAAGATASSWAWSPSVSPSAGGSAAAPASGLSVAPAAPAIASAPGSQAGASVGSSAPGSSASALVGSSASPSVSASPSSSLEPAPTAGPFAIDLYERGDFVSERNKVSCVPAAMQTMINIMSPGADTTIATQQRLYTLARKLSPKTLKGPGAEPEGWARGLAELGFGSYVVNVQPTRVAAIKAAAKALRLTGRPVGILAWRGAHSWVMSGFKATADPALTDSFKVTAVYIEDVWYPRISTIWGPSRPPDTLVPVSLLREDILPWRRPTGAYPGKDGKYVLVLPAPA